MITNRLLAVKNAVKHSDVTIDVGTDHGYVPILLVQEGRAKKVIAADVRQGPLRNAETNIKKFKLTHQIELRLGSGLAPIRAGEADTAILAGMGGILISTLLSEEEKKAKAMNLLVLQPMNSQEILRKYLLENGYAITGEILAQEKEKIYQIILAKPGKSKPYQREIYYHVGDPNLYQGEDPSLPQIFWEKKARQFDEVISRLSQAKKNVEQELLYYQTLREELKCLG